MKYSIFFAATAAAYDAYGGYGAQQSSSAPAKVSSSAPAYGGYGDHPVTSVKSTPGAKATPCSTVVGSNGYTTVVPGYGKPPVTVTQQHQAYPTCVSKGYDGKSCDKWEDDKYVSTTITDYNKKVVTITKVQDYVTVYHEKKTITHYATPSAVSTPVGGYGAAPTPVGGKNATGNWYELYEKVITCEYQKMGKNNGLSGYSGPGLCQKCDDEQEVVIKEYKGGKWTEEKKTLNYGKPKDEVKVYEKPGVYTVPAKVVTVYGSQSTGKPSHEAGIYHFDAKTITITKSNQAYTCTYDLPKQTPSKPCNGYDCKDDTPAKVTKTPTHDDYGYKASATPTPKKPSNDYPVYPNYPVKSNTTSYGHGYADKPTPTPVTISKPVYGDDYKPSSSAPTKPTSTPCDEDKKKHPTPTPNKPVYDNGNNYGEAPKPTPTPAKPVYDNGNNGGYGGEAPKPTPTPAKPVYENNQPGYGAEAPKPTPAKPAAYPADPSGGYGSNTEYGKTNTGYTKRGGMIERRRAVVEAQKAKRNIVL